MQELKKKEIFVNWKYEERDGQKTKVPYNPMTGGKAQSNNPETWASFEDAQSRAAEYDGIGFMFADGICGVDTDNKKDDPDIERQAQTIINLFDAYTERSPSGKGYHIIFKCDLSKIPTANGKLDGKYYQKNPNNDLECYFSGLTNRYFTYTGDIIRDNPIEDRTEQALVFLDSYMLKDNFKKKKEPKAEPRRADEAASDILDRIRNSKQGFKFSALFDRGDIGGYNSHSEADQALCNILAWWLQGDFDAVDSYFRQSALYREDKWVRDDYRAATINNGVSLCRGNFYTPPGRPKKESKAAGKEQTKNIHSDNDEKYITIEAVAEYLSKIGVTLKYNETTRKADVIVNKTKTIYENFQTFFTLVHNNFYNYFASNLPIKIYDKLNLLYKKCSVGILQDFLKVHMTENAYNPVVELIEGGKWDGVDRLPELFRIMRIADDDELSRVLIVKWLWQNLSMARNDRGEYGADGLLVLKGEQATGKTSFARKMALRNEWFGESLILDVRNKDTIITAVSCWIGELGEIESTFKSDINALKGFITLPADNYRVPYGRNFEYLPRRTSYIGTCNSDEYLIDETGNRRYWTVPINERMDLDALKNFDALQLYLQIDERAKRDVQGYRLTPEENAQLSERNRRHEKPMKAEHEVMDILTEFSDAEFKKMTVSKFMDCYPRLGKFDAAQVGKALNKIGLKQIRDEEGRYYMLPYNVKTI